MVNIRKQLVAQSIINKVTSGTGNGRKWITIHGTGNASKGAHAAAHGNLQANGNSREASWHYTVDEKEAVQSFNHNIKCWAAGDGSGNGNMNSIHIEICVNSDGDYKKTIANAVDLVKKIMKEENIPLANVVQHNYWSGKNCPAEIRAGKDGITWSKFKDMLKDDITTVSKPVSKPSTNNNEGYYKNGTGLYRIKKPCNAYNGVNFGKSKKMESLKKGDVFTIVDIVKSGNAYRLKTTSGLFITAKKEYVEKV